MTRGRSFHYRVPSAWLSVFLHDAGKVSSCCHWTLDTSLRTSLQVLRPYITVHRSLCAGLKMLRARSFDLTFQRSRCALLRMLRLTYVEMALEKSVRPGLM